MALRTNGRFANRFPYRTFYETAHSAPIYVNIAGKPSQSDQPRARAVAKKWLASLTGLEHRLSDANINYVHESNALFSRYDSLPLETLMKNRAALLDEIGIAKKYFTKYVAE